jgi:transposase
MDEQPMKKATTPATVKPRRKYDDAYKQQALQLLRQGQSVPRVAQALGISEGLLYRWKQSLRPAAVEQELDQLRQKLKQVETERDILKKALSIFSRPT